MRFAKAGDDDDNVRDWVLDEAVNGGGAVTAASARTPPTKPLSTTVLLVFASANAPDPGGVEVDVDGGILRPNSR